MDSLTIPDIGDTLHSIAGLSPAAQLAAIFCLGAIVVTWIWSRRPQPGPDAQIVVEALKSTAQAQVETAASIAAMAQQNELIVSEVRGAVAEMRVMVNAALATIKQAA
nr:hypothetical protein [uncultured Azospirillum sp.]